MCYSASMSERVTIHWHLTHWGRVTHICVGNLTIIGPDNGLSPGRCQAIIWTNAGILLIGPWGTNFSEILIGIHKFSFKKINLKMAFCEMASILSRPQCVNQQNKHVRKEDWGLSQYNNSLAASGDLHYKGKTVMRPSYLHNGNSYIGKTTSLYWDGSQAAIFFNHL